MALNILTVFCTVIFLYILMIFRNAVPMTNGILMATGSSVTYFVMSMITLLFLFACHECASYMVLQYHGFIVAFYGLLVLALGMSGFKQNPGLVADIWDNVLSAN